MDRATPFSRDARPAPPARWRRVRVAWWLAPASLRREVEKHADIGRDQQRVDDEIGNQASSAPSARARPPRLAQLSAHPAPATAGGRSRSCTSRRASQPSPKTSSLRAEEHEVRHVRPLGASARLRQQHMAVSHDRASIAMPLPTMMRKDQNTCVTGGCSTVPSSAT